MFKEISQTLTATFIPTPAPGLAEARPSSFGALPQGSSFQNSTSSTAAEVKQVSDKIETDLQTAIKTIDVQTQQRLIQVNSRLQAQGKPAIDFQKTTDDIQKILNDTSLSPKDKKKKIDDLRKQLGLSRGEMKSLFTQRMSRLYKMAELKMKAYQNQKLLGTQAELKQAQQIYGANSPQVQKIKEKEAVLRSQLDPKIEQCRDNSETCRKACKKRGFFSKLGGVFKKAAGFLSKVIHFAKPFLQFIPGFGQIASVAASVAEAGLNAIKTKGKSLFGGASNS